MTAYSRLIHNFLLHSVIHADLDEFRDTLRNHVFKLDFHRVYTLKEGDLLMTNKEIGEWRRGRRLDYFMAHNVGDTGTILAHVVNGIVNSYTKEDVLVKMMKTLVYYGADVNATFSSRRSNDVVKKTIIFMLMEKDRWDLVRFLEENNADPEKEILVVSKRYWYRETAIKPSEYYVNNPYKMNIFLDHFEDKLDITTWRHLYSIVKTDPYHGTIRDRIKRKMDEIQANLNATLKRAQPELPDSPESINSSASKSSNMSHKSSGSKSSKSGGKRTRTQKNGSARRIRKTRSHKKI